MIDIDVQAILRKPYARVFLCDEETGYVTGLILEFPGCVAQGSDHAEAWNNLQEAAESWLTSLAKTAVLPIPEPFETSDPQSRNAVGRLIPLWKLLEDWKNKEQVTRHDDLASLDLAPLVKKLLKLVGYYQNPKDPEAS